MYMHQFLHKIHEEQESAEDSPTFLQYYIYPYLYAEKEFYYNIASFKFNIDEIKHGLLRNNKKSPNHYYWPCLVVKDDRLTIL